MGKAIKLFFVFILLQVLAGAAAVPLVLVWQFVTTGTVTAYEAGAATQVPSSMLMLIFTVWYLWKKGYLDNDGQIYSPVSPAYLGWTFVAGLSAIVLMEGLMSVLDFLPNWLEGTFRLIHFNPAQSVAGFLMGMLLAWLYYRTRSVVPGILVHVVNNSLSVWGGMNFPDVDYLYQMVGGTTYAVCLCVAAVAFVLSVWRLARYPKAPNYDCPSMTTEAKEDSL